MNHVKLLGWWKFGIPTLSGGDSCSITLPKRWWSSPLIKILSLGLDHHFRIQALLHYETNLFKKPCAILHLKTLTSCLSKFVTGTVCHEHYFFSKFLHFLLLDDKVLPVEHLHLGLLLCNLELREQIRHFLIDVILWVSNIALLLSQYVLSSEDQRASHVWATSWGWWLNKNRLRTLSRILGRSDWLDELLRLFSLLLKDVDVSFQLL